jgi:hypothetical protein
VLSLLFSDVAVQPTPRKRRHVALWWWSCGGRGGLVVDKKGRRGPIQGQLVGCISCCKGIRNGYGNSIHCRSTPHHRSRLEHRVRPRHRRRVATGATRNAITSRRFVINSFTIDRRTTPSLLVPRSLQLFTERVPSSSPNETNIQERRAISLHAPAIDSEANGRSSSGVLGTAASWGIIGPARKAARPARIALAKAPAIWTGSTARETAVFNNTPSKPHSIT